MSFESKPETPRKTRSAYLDNLRSFVIFLVVAMHSNVTYSGMGGWYYKEGNPAALDPLSLLCFGFYGSFTQAWFMGLLFFLAAVFAARSLAKRGPAAFIKERLFRLGAPLLLYVFVITPLMGYYLQNVGGIRDRIGFGGAYLQYVQSMQWLESTGPLWFAEALLIFSALYTSWRTLRPRRTEAAPVGAPPSAQTILLTMLGTGLAAFCIRLYFPIGTDVLNLQFSFFASYIALFLLGLKAGEEGWFEALLDKHGLRWFTVILAAGIPLWLLQMLAGGALSGRLLIEGGLYWQSFAYAFWEAAVAIGFSIGISAFFKRFLDKENVATRFLATNAFGVFVFHAPILVAISLSLRDWDAAPLAKHATVAPMAFVASLAFSALVRRIPGFGPLLK